MGIRKLAAWAGRRLPGAVLLLSLAGAGVAHATAPLVPLKELLEHPDQYEGQRVRVTGFLRLAIERNGVYMTRDDFNNAVKGHALLLDLKNSQLRSASRLNSGHVIVEGTFSAPDKSPGEHWAGALKQASGLQMWRKPRQK